MKIVHSCREMQDISLQLKSNGQSIAFVPTMGFLHEGHLSLVKIAHQQADIVVLSIFVNPKQFAANEDLSTYPRDFDKDTMLCEGERVDYLFFPDAEEMYPKGFQTIVDVENVTQTLCGLSRPTHFRGVTTVVNKLFQIVLPNFAIFGPKN